MARRRINRMPLAELNAEALGRAHPFQKIALEALFAHGWIASMVSTSTRGATVVVMRMANDSKIGAAVYPDGSFGRSKTPTVRWDWTRANNAKDATTPDIFVKNILEKRKEFA